ncbi:unnamed protein product, partial [Mesorhabditis spiculigera]
MTIGLLALFGWSLFSLHFLGVIATSISSSFLLSIFILYQLGQLCAQFVILAFTLTVRTRLHRRLEDVYIGKARCSTGFGCEPVSRFQHSETLLIVFFSVCTLAQIALLIASSVLCERISYKELLKAQAQREREEDEDALFADDGHDTALSTART